MELLEILFPAEGAFFLLYCVAAAVGYEFEDESPWKAWAGPLPAPASRPFGTVSIQDHLAISQILVSL